MLNAFLSSPELEVVVAVAVGGLMARNTCEQFSQRSTARQLKSEENLLV